VTGTRTKYKNGAVFRGVGEDENALETSAIEELKNKVENGRGKVGETFTNREEIGEGEGARNFMCVGARKKQKGGGRGLGKIVWRTKGASYQEKRKEGRGNP